MDNKFENWMNDYFSDWVVTMVFATHFAVVMIILAQLACGR